MPDISDEPTNITFVKVNYAEMRMLFNHQSLVSNVSLTAAVFYFFNGDLMEEKTLKFTGKPDWEEFARFHKLLTKNRKDYIPHYFRLEAGGKDPYKDPITGRSWEDKKFRLGYIRAIAWMQRGGNIGIAAAKDDPLVIVDVDKENDVLDIKPTLRVRSRKQIGTHNFFFTTENKKDFNIPCESGEIRAYGQYVVACGSFVNSEAVEREDGIYIKNVMKSGEVEYEGAIPPERIKDIGRYHLDNELNVSSITYAEFPEVYRKQKIHAEELDKAAAMREKLSPVKVKCDFSSKKHSALYDITIQNIVDISNVKSRFPSLFHGSSTGQNTSVDTKRNLLTCWREHVTHNPLQCLAVMAGLGSCGDVGKAHKNSKAGASSIDLKDGKTIYQIWTFAKEQGQIPKDDKIPFQARRFQNLQKVRAMIYG